MKLIVGLGNPGREYEGTRHNVGFRVLDLMRRKMEEIEDIPLIWRLNRKFAGELIKHGDLILLKPLTYMNLSGSCVFKLVDYYDIDEADVIVLHDDLDLKVGVINIKVAGGSGGHHGLDSINQVLKKNKYCRIRVGVGKAGDKEAMTAKEGADYVLSGFSSGEKVIMEEIEKKCVEALFCCLKRPLVECQNLYNKKISSNLPMED